LLIDCSNNLCIYNLFTIYIQFIYDVLNKIFVWVVFTIKA